MFTVIGERINMTRKRIREEIWKRNADDIARDVKCHEQADLAENGLYSEEIRGYELAEEFRFRQQRLQNIREAKAALEGKLDDEDNPKPPKHGRRPKTPPRTPPPKVQRNFTDLESRILRQVPDGPVLLPTAFGGSCGRRRAASRMGSGNRQIVEPIFGQMKHGRGLRQFLLRGLEKIDAEWSLWCTTHKLLKIWAAGNTVWLAI